MPQPSTPLYQLDWMSVFTKGVSHWPDVLNLSFCTSFCKNGSPTIKIACNFFFFCLTDLTTAQSSSSSYRTAHRELVTFEEAWPASLLVHDATRPTRRRTQALAGQLDSTVLTFGHVNGTKQRLDDRPAARSISQTWSKKKKTVLNQLEMRGEDTDTGNACSFLRTGQ